MTSSLITKAILEPVEMLRVKLGAYGEHLPPLADAVNNALRGTRLCQQWDTDMGRSLIIRLAMVQPWSRQDLPTSALLNSAPAADRLAVALGALFDAISLPSFLTHQLSTRWVVQSSKIVTLCNQTRDRMNPEAVAWRRGGKKAFRRDKAQAEEDAAAAGGPRARPAKAARGMKAQGRAPNPRARRYHSEVASMSGSESDNSSGSSYNSSVRSNTDSGSDPDGDYQERWRAAAPVSSAPHVRSQPRRESRRPARYLG